MSDDDVLLEALREVVAEVDGVPEAVLVGAKQAFALRSLDVDLAHLTFDSWTEPAGASGLRAAGDRHRHLAFASGSVTIAFEIDVDSRRVVGQVTPARAVDVEVRSTSWSTSSPTDEHGRFTFEDVPTGPASIRVSAPDGEIVATEWVTL